MFSRFRNFFKELKDVVNLFESFQKEVLKELEDVKKEIENIKK